MKLSNKIKILIISPIILFTILLFYGAYSNLSKNTEIKTITGSFEEVLISNYRRTDKYSIKLKEFDNLFTVSKVITKSFNYSKFNNEVGKGNTLTIRVDKNIDLNKYNANIFSLKKGHIEYIDQSKRIEKRKENGIMAIIGGCIFLVCSLRIYFKM